MSSTPYMQFYVADFIGDTLHLTTEEVGAYLLLLMAMWQGKGSLPNDAAKLSRMARVPTRRWGNVWAAISGFFDAEGPTITNARLAREYQIATEKVILKRQLGALGGKAKALKTKAPPVATASVSLWHYQNQNQKEEKKEAIASQKRRKPEVPIPPDWVPSDRNIADAEARQFSAKDIAHEADQFRNHHTAKGSAFRDWDAAWRTWIGNARRFSPKPDATLHAIAVAAASRRTPNPDWN